MLSTPGHSSDGISLYAGDRVFTGDRLLIHGTGRTDFPGGEAGAEYDGTHEKLFRLPDETIVFPAHDYPDIVSPKAPRARAEVPHLLG